MAYKEWRPRLSIEIDKDQYKKLQDLIPWGVKNQLFKVIIEDLIKALESNGQYVIGALLSRSLKLRDISKGVDDVSD